MSTVTDYKVIGTRPVRHDGADKVTGRALYGADYSAAGLVHGFILRSPHAHARIVKIDVSKAAKVPGVLAIVTAADMPDGGDQLVDIGDGPTPLRYVRGNVLALDKVLYKGHAVAAVAAANLHVAEEAASLIEVEYEPLESVLTAPDAMKDTAPRLHGDTNVASHYQHVKGDVAAGFAAADVIVEREFTTSTVHQGYIEPQNGTVFWSRRA